MLPADCPKTKKTGPTTTTDEDGAGGVDTTGTGTETGKKTPATVTGGDGAGGADGAGGVDKPKTPAAGETDREGLFVFL